MQIKRKNDRMKKANFITFLMKKLLIILPLLLLGAGCFHSNAEDPNEKALPASANSYQADEFSISPPLDSQKKTWETITTFTKEFPAGAIAAFRDNVKDEKFTANINVYKKSVPADVSSANFALSEIRNQEKNVLNFKELSRENVKIAISDQNVDTILFYFEGKEKAEEEIIKFFQIFGVKNAVGYIVTGSAASDALDETVKKIEESLRSLVIK